jgi:Zn-dependent protease
MSSLTVVQQLAVWALPILFAITLHEVAHGWVARAMGDPTAANLGRLSLNPLSHVDPVGTLLLPGLMIVLSALGLGGLFLFGWAKPVPVDWRNFKNPRRDMAVVAIAGPLSNFAMAFLWGLVYKFANPDGIQEGVRYGVQLMGVAGISINLSLMVLNLLPLPPLDGGRVAVGLLPLKTAHRFARIEPYGIAILLLLAMTNVLGALLTVPYALSKALLVQLLGLT